MPLSALTGASGAYITEARQRLAQEEQQTTTLASHLTDAAKSGDDAELKIACEAFESYFMNMMLKEMRKTSFSTPESNALTTFRDMLDTEYAAKATESGGIGLATFLYNQMKKGQ